MRIRLKTEILTSRTAVLLAVVLLLAPQPPAQASVVCQEIFARGTLAVPAPPLKSSLFSKIISKFKSGPRSKYVDPQTQIRRLEGEGRSAEAQALREELVRALSTEPEIETIPVNQGISGAKIVRFASGHLGVVKRSLKYWQDPGAEVAAYQLNMFFNNFVNVPVTIRRVLNGEVVSVQAHIFNAKEAWYSDVSRIYLQRLRFFDYLTDNPDRKPSNWLIDSAQHFAAIDNGLGFRSKVALDPDPHNEFGEVTPETAWSLTLRAYFSKDETLRVIDMNKAKEFILKVLPPKEDYAKLKATPDKVFEDLLSPYISAEDVAAFIKRKNFLIETTEEWLQSGHSYPLYVR